MPFALQLLVLKVVITLVALSLPTVLLFELGQLLTQRWFEKYGGSAIDHRRVANATIVWLVMVLTWVLAAVCVSARMLAPSWLDLLLCMFVMYAAAIFFAGKWYGNYGHFRDLTLNKNQPR